MDEHTARHMVRLLTTLDAELKDVGRAVTRTNDAIDKLRADMEGVQSFLLQHNTAVGELCERFSRLWCVKQGGGGRTSVEIKAPKIIGRDDGGDCGCTHDCAERGNGAD